jgi:transcriptional regulator with XRE-family HTH domain
MSNVTHIHKGKQPRRPHYIEDWAASRGLKQADLARELGADKGLVSRWYNGGTPGVEWQRKLADFFDCEPESLFRHPDDDWLAQFFANRSRAEIEKIKRTLETAFPKNGTDN